MKPWNLFGKFWKISKLSPRALRRILKLFLLLAAFHYVFMALFFSSMLQLAFRKHPNPRLFQGLNQVRRQQGGFRRRYSPEYLSNLQWLKAFPSEHWSLTARDGARLSAQFFRQPGACSRVALVAHGYRGAPSRVAHFIQFYYASMGYHVLCPLARAHGSSDGECITFGWLEKADLEGWFQLLQEELGPECKLVLHGVSMGGSTVLMGAPLLPPESLLAVIADSSFTELRESFYHRFAFFPKFFGELILKEGNRYLQASHGFTLFEIDVLRGVESLQVPLLVVHGLLDQVTPYKMASEIYEKASSCPLKRLLLLPHANHADGWFVDQAPYVEAIRNLIAEAEALKSSAS